MKNVYLAGPITGLSYGEATDWRDSFITRFSTNPDVKITSPMRLKEHLAHVEKFGPHGAEKGVSSNRAVFGRDTWDVRNCDILLVNAKGCTKASIGTAVEIGVAVEARKFIILVIGENEWTHRTPGVESTPTNNPFDHLFMHEACDMVVHDLEDAAKIIEAL